MGRESFKFWKKHRKEPDKPHVPSHPPTVGRDRALVVRPGPSSSEPSPGRSQTPEANWQPDLWNQAYDRLKFQDQKTVQAYEMLLSITLKNEHALVTEETHNRIGDSAEDRLPQMKKLLEIGLAKTESSTATYAKIKGGIDTMLPFQELITTAMKTNPEAAVVWVGVTFAVEILQNPFTEPGLTRAGITHVVSRMEWYWDLASLLLDSESISYAQRPLQQHLETRILELYQKLLSYQMKSICRYFKSKLVNFWKDVIMLDNWQGQLDSVKAAEAALVQDMQMFDNRSIVGHLQRLSSTANSQYTALEKFVSLIQDEIRGQHESTRLREERDCLKHLCSTNPSLDRQRIIKAKGGLLWDSYRWVLENREFKHWQKNAQSRRLWITGDPGKGKTMLMCGIIEELKKDPFKRLCYFFCQATLEKLNNAQAVLRGLIYHLAVEYPWLISYVVTEYELRGRTLFEDHNAWQAMSNILRAMLPDEGLNEVLLLVDGLDECVTEQEDLLDLIAEISANPRVKLTISSRNWPVLKQAFGDTSSQAATLSLEINGDRVAEAVEAYIKQKMRDLARQNPYKNNPKVCREVELHLTAKSNNTFLWVALVCKALGRHGILNERHVRIVLEESPSGLEELYERMISGIVESIDAKRYEDILATTSVVHRPLSLEELSLILESGDEIESLEQDISSCGSFLYLQDGLIYFVHQSAKEFLHNEKKSSFDLIFPSGVKHAHQMVFSRSLRAMSKVIRRDVYGLEAPDVHINDIAPPQPDFLASSTYCLLYWVDHLIESDSATDLKDRGTVHEFLGDKFLYWLEALALLNHIPQAVQSIQKLRRLVLAAFVYDADRFLLYHRVMIQNTPLQLYASALAFSPEESIVKRTFLESHTAVNKVRLKAANCEEEKLEGARRDYAS
ncbi:nacht and wd domain protein [Colletotrichum kahawae]|uniref:Nacht and wd domain protein n=1 Tax=Colletotrichum kahawae TaxID=34407 RepID=A0AAD9YHU2_COLKA|nr:nacht and wd domain protein [Colletotrichum kahawae]